MLQVIFAYGNTNGSGSDRLDAPCHLHVDKLGYVMVVDRNNDRVLLLSPNLVFIRDLINGSKYDIKKPRRMCFDASTGLLYLGMITGKVVIARIANY